ncbi:Uncharacterised protein [Candidatus Gugararchaeum adminiculabundum]|nr:Uncharacterised protein [Candidatus Gugararchaeum adminiculabundum]
MYADLVCCDVPKKLQNDSEFASYFDCRKLRFCKSRRIKDFNECDVLSTDSLEVIRAGAKRTKLIFLSNFKADAGIVRTVAIAKRCFLIPLAPLLKSDEIEKGRMIGRMKLFVSLCVKYKAEYALVTMAQDEYQLRSVKEICAIGQLLGLTREQSLYSLTHLKHLLKEKEEKSGDEASSKCPTV